ncbi:MAG: hypothetical protein GC179_16180 [Anaerolineaceae bacterium]|nr:hypothetical protein [Anaerolineaceae bacterium]
MQTVNLPVDPQTLAAVLQVGGQYMLPIAAILRALYAGSRGKFPEGAVQIGTAAIIAGVSAGVNGQQPDIKNILNDVLSNTVFTAGLVSFIVIYLLRASHLTWIVDAVVGGIIGAVLWLFTNYILGVNWPLWFLFLVIPACAAGMVALRFALRQIFRVVRYATYLIIIGLVLALGAGGFLLLQTIMSGLAKT